jgi:hypothetical protein
LNTSTLLASEVRTRKPFSPSAVVTGVFVHRPAGGHGETKRSFWFRLASAASNASRATSARYRAPPRGDPLRPQAARRVVLIGDGDAAIRPLEHFAREGRVRLALDRRRGIFVTSREQDERDGDERGAPWHGARV